MCFANGLGTHKGGNGMKVFWVSKRLAFGSAITTWGHVEQLQALGITHVVNLRHGKHGKKVCQFKNLHLPFKDDKKPRPRWYYGFALLRARHAQVAVQDCCDVPPRNLSECVAYLLLPARGIRLLPRSRPKGHTPGQALCSRGPRLPGKR